MDKSDKSKNMELAIRRTLKKKGSKKTSIKKGSKQSSIKKGSKQSSKKKGSKQSSKKKGSNQSSKKMGSKRSSKKYYAAKMKKMSPGYKVAKRSKSWAKRGNALASRKILPPVGDEIILGDYGYSLQDLPKERKASLKRASKKNNTLTVLRRVNLIRNYSKSVPTNYNKLSQDVEFLKKEYKKEKESN